MRLVLIITNLATGGAETMLLKLLQGLDRSRFNPTVISMIGLGEIGPRIEALGIPIHVLGMRRGAPNPMVVVRLTRLLRQLRPDVVHTWMYHADLLGGIAARLAGCRRVIWCLRHSNLSKTENKRSTLAVVAMCARVSSWLPMKILSCSNRAKEVHAEAGYASEKIYVIPNGFDLSRFTPDFSSRFSLRAELGLPAETQLVGVVARFDVQKNHIGFVHAAAQLLKEMPAVHFVLAGTGVDDKNLELKAAIASHPSLQSHMHLLGRRDDIPRLMAALDVLASPSHGEAFPNVLGEAMACAIPCVVTDAGDSAEIVGDSGRVVAVNDMASLTQQIFEILQLTAAQRAAQGELARARIQAEYEISHVVELYQEFYERVAAEK